jgi:hypothetical protein
MVELYLPWKSFNIKAAIPGQKFWTADQATSRHIALAQKAHPNWPALSRAARKLMIRNAMIIARFDKPVDFVVAMPNQARRGWGGTGHAIRCAELLNIRTHVIERLPPI